MKGLPFTRKSIACKSRMMSRFCECMRAFVVVYFVQTPAVVIGIVVFSGPSLLLDAAPICINLKMHPYKSCTDLANVCLDSTRCSFMNRIDCVTVLCVVFIKVVTCESEHSCFGSIFCENHMGNSSNNNSQHRAALVESRVFNK